MIKKLFFFLIVCLSSQVFGQIKFEQRKNNVSKHYQLTFSKLYELLKTDIDSAEIKVDLLKRELELINKSDLSIELLALEAEHYRSKGDYIHMKLCIYQALSMKDKSTSHYDQLVLAYLSALNDGLNGKTKRQEQQLLYVNLEAKKFKFYFLEAQSYLALARLDSDKERFEEAENHLMSASELFKKSGYKNLYYSTEVAIGINKFWKKDYRNSLSYFHKFRTYSHTISNKKCIANAYINLAEAYIFIPNSLDSAAYYLNLFENIKEDADKRDVFQFYWNKEAYYIARKNTDSAYHYLQKAYVLDDELKFEIRMKNRKEIDQLYQKLQNQKELQDEKDYHEFLKTIFGFCGIFLVCILLLSWFILIQKSKSNLLLNKQNEEIIHKNKIIDDSLKEKELLLKEIHHRVKNNLQIISSLLNLQIENILDPEAKKSLFEAKERIQAMALIHQKLYRNDAYYYIALSTYFEDLISQIKSSYLDENKNIEFQIKTGDITLNLDTVVPLGLIVCELITNAFKYAFNTKKEGHIKIEVQHAEDNFYTLKVKDNGAGMQDDFNYLSSKTLGVEIINALTEQLDGKISYTSDENGTHIKIKFKSING